MAMESRRDELVNELQRITGWGDSFTVDRVGIYSVKVTASKIPADALALEDNGPLGVQILQVTHCYDRYDQPNAIIRYGWG